jgi:hypothetical protein
MDLMEIGLVISMVSVSVAVLKLNNGKVKNSNTDNKYKKIELCDEIHKNVDEKLACLPEIKKVVTQIETKVDMLMK